MASSIEKCGRPWGTWALVLLAFLLSGMAAAAAASGDRFDLSEQPVFARERGRRGSGLVEVVEPLSRPRRRLREPVIAALAILLCVILSYNQMRMKNQTQAKLAEAAKKHEQAEAKASDQLAQLEQLLRKETKRASLATQLAEKQEKEIEEARTSLAKSEEMRREAEIKRMAQLAESEEELKESEIAMMAQLAKSERMRKEAEIEMAAQLAKSERLRKQTEIEMAAQLAKARAELDDLRAELANSAQLEKLELITQHITVSLALLKERETEAEELIHHLTDSLALLKEARETEAARAKIATEVVETRNQEVEAEQAKRLKRITMQSKESLARFQEAQELINSRVQQRLATFAKLTAEQKEEELEAKLHMLEEKLQTFKEELDPIMAATTQTSLAMRDQALTILCQKEAELQAVQDALDDSIALQTKVDLFAIGTENPKLIHFQIELEKAQKKLVEVTEQQIAEFEAALENVSKRTAASQAGTATS